VAPARLTPPSRPAPRRRRHGNATEPYRRALSAFLKLADLAVIAPVFVLVSRMVPGRKTDVCDR